MNRSSQKNGVDGDGRCDGSTEQHGKFFPKCKPHSLPPHIEFVIDSIRSKYGGNVNGVIAMKA